jgi:4-amino-4-deoxy-L-arabinose transferase-like glycosyltransferase
LELPNKSRNVLQIIGITAVARLLLAATLGLGVDESYAVSVARPLSLGYFDHPPLHFWIAGAMTWLAGSPPAGPIADLIVRFPFVVLFALTTWLLYLTTARLFDSRAGLWAVIALNLSAVFTLSTASWVLPDGPLMCASMATVYCLVRALEGGNAEAVSTEADRAARSPRSSLRWWAAAGIGGGCAMLSKYHGVFVLAGILLFLATTPQYRHWLARPYPYLAAAIAALLFAPDLVWNSHHGWVSFAFQAARGTPVHANHLESLARNIGGQIAYVLPWVWVPLVGTLIGALVAGRRDPKRWLFACLAIIPIALFTLVSLGGNPGLPHWPALGYLMCFPLFGRWAAGRDLERWSAISAATLVAVVILLAVQTTTGILPIPPSADPTLDLIDWRALQPVAHTQVIAAPSWIQAGKAAYALGDNTQVIALSPAPHQYLYKEDPTALLGSDALFVIRPPKKGGATDIDRYRPNFATIDPVGPLTIRRLNGRPAFTVDLYLAHDLRQPFPTSQPR